MNGHSQTIFVRDRIPVMHRSSVIHGEDLALEVIRITNCLQVSLREIVDVIWRCLDQASTT